MSITKDRRCHFCFGDYNLAQYLISLIQTMSTSGNSYNPFLLKRFQAVCEHKIYCTIVQRLRLSRNTLICVRLLVLLQTKTSSSCFIIPLFSAQCIFVLRNFVVIPCQESNKLYNKNDLFCGFKKCNSDLLYS